MQLEKSLEDLTREKEKLYITNARSRMIYGNTSITRPSRFVSEIPEELIDSNLNEPQQTFYGGYPQNSGYSQGSFGGVRTFGSSSADYQRSRPAQSRPQTSASGFSRGGFSGASASAKKDAVSLDFKVGDRVKHKTFGDGLILSAKAVGGDMVLEIAFDDVGTKKVMAKVAKLIKIFI